MREKVFSIFHPIPEGESEFETENHFDSDDDEDFIPQNVSIESEDSYETSSEGKQLFTLTSPFTGVTKQRYKMCNNTFFPDVASSLPRDHACAAL